MKKELNLNSCRGIQYAVRKDGRLYLEKRILRRVLRACLKQRFIGKNEIKRKKLSTRYEYTLLQDQLIESKYISLWRMSVRGRY